MSNFQFQQIRDDLLGIYNEQLHLRRKLMEINDQALDIVLSLVTKRTLIESYEGRGPMSDLAESLRSKFQQ